MKFRQIIHLFFYYKINLSTLNLQALGNIHCNKLIIVWQCYSLFYWKNEEISLIQCGIWFTILSYCINEFKLYFIAFLFKKVFGTLILNMTENIINTENINTCNNKKIIQYLFWKHLFTLKLVWFIAISQLVPESTNVKVLPGIHFWRGSHKSK